MSSQEQISYLDNILESLEGFTGEVEYTSTDIQIMLEKFSRISKKEILEENIPLLVTCCLKYVDFLLQFSKIFDTTHPQYKRHLQKYFSVLTEIGQKKKLNNRFMKALAVPILERIIDPSIRHFHGQELASNLSRIAENCNSNLKNEIVNFSARIHIFKLADLIETCGDYEYQTCLVKTLHKMCSSDFIAENIKELFPGAENLQRRFLDIKVENYDGNLRRFLNAVNHINKNVSSIIVSTAHLDEYSIKPPMSISNYNMDLWVDFNLSSRTIGIFCNKNSFETKPASVEDDQELLTFFADEISFVELKRETLETEELFQLCVLFHKIGPCHYKFYKTAEAAFANKLKLVIQDEVVNKLKEVLLNMFGQKFETFKEMNHDSQITVYCTPEIIESVTAINHADKICVSSDSRSERSYANVLLCRNVEDAEEIRMQNVTIRKPEVFTNKIAHQEEENKENIGWYKILNQEGNSVAYFNCKENEKPENERSHYLSRSVSECIHVQDLTDSAVTSENLVRNSDKTYLDNNKKSKKFDPNTESIDFTSVKVAKPKKPRQKKQIKTAKQNKDIKTLPTILEHDSRGGKPKENLIENSDKYELFETSSQSHLKKETQNFTSENIIRMPDVIVEKINYVKYLNKDSLQCLTNCKEHTWSNAEEVASVSPLNSIFNVATEKFESQEDLNNFNSLQNLTNDEEHTCTNAEEVDGVSIPSSIFNIGTQKLESQENLNNFNLLQNLTNDEEHTCTNAEEVDGVSIPSSIFNIGTQKLESQENLNNFNSLRCLISDTNTEEVDDISIPNSNFNVASQKFKSQEDLNKTPESFVQENNELRQKELAPEIFEDDAFSYMEMETDANSTDSEISIHKTIVTEAIVHEPAPNTVHHKQNQIKMKIKRSVNHRDLDSINVIEGNTHLNKKQANSNKRNVKRAEKKINLKETEALCKEPTPDNEQSKQNYLPNQEISLLPNNNDNEQSKQNYLPNQEMSLLPNKSGEIAGKSEFFMKHFQSEIKDNKPKKGKKTSSKTKQRDLLKDMPVDCFDETGNNVDIKLYIEYTSCFDKPPNRKGKSNEEKSKRDNSFHEIKTMKKRKNLDFSDKKPAKQMRVSNESSKVKTMTKIKRKRSIVEANEDGNEEVSESTERENPKMVKKTKAPKVQILQNIILQPATNSIVNNI